VDCVHKHSNRQSRISVTLSFSTTHTHVKDVLAVLRWAQNPRDRVSGFRAMQLLTGVGPKTAGRILDNVANAPPGAALVAEQPVPEGAREAWAEFSELIEMIGKADATWRAPFEKIGQWYIAQPVRRTTARRGLSDPLYHPLGQGTGMDGGGNR
jgi:hypothetical protein